MRISTALACTFATLAAYEGLQAPTAEAAQVPETAHPETATINEDEQVAFADIQTPQSVSAPTSMDAPEFAPVQNIDINHEGELIALNRQLIPSPIRHPSADQAEFMQENGPNITINGERLPAVPALPAQFLNPIVLVQATGGGASSHPITDSTSGNMADWEARVRNCLHSNPRLISVDFRGNSVPVLFDGQEGTIVQNANGHAVCPGY